MLNNYEICLNGDFEVGIEKIVIYLDSNGIPTHAARQLDHQWWTSKLGRQHDISHSLNALNNGSYGNPSIFMRRAILNLVP